MTCRNGSHYECDKCNLKRVCIEYRMSRVRPDAKASQKNKGN